MRDLNIVFFGRIPQDCGFSPFATSRFDHALGSGMMIAGEILMALQAAAGLTPDVDGVSSPALLVGAGLTLEADGVSSPALLGWCRSDTGG